METDAPLDSAAPTPLKEKAMSEDLKAGDHEDCCSQMSEESTDQNLPHDSNPNEDELLGLPTNISVPGGHSNDSITLVISPGEDNLWTTSTICNLNGQWWEPGGHTGWNRWDQVCLNPHPQPRIMGPNQFLYISYVNHVLFFLNKAAATRSCQRAWGRVLHAACCPFSPGN